MSPPGLAILDPVEVQRERLEQVRAELCRRNLAAFAKRAWQEIDPAPLVWSWHLDAICEHLQAVSDGRITRLLINVPPGYAKSLMTSVIWPAWEWARNPGWRSLFASYAGDLSIRDAVRCRTLIESPWYQTHFTRIPRKLIGKHLARVRPDMLEALRREVQGAARAELLARLERDEPEVFRWRLASDQNVKSYFANTARGEHLSLSVGGKATGFRGDAQIVDDPMNAEDAHRAAEREKSRRWFFESMSSRLNDLATGARVVIAQRLHDDDVPGHILRKAKAGGEYWDHLCLASEYDPKARCDCPCCARGHTSIGWRDPRTKAGDLLFPAKFGAEVLRKAKIDLGSTAYAAQHEQRPLPASGGMLKAPWFAHVWREPGEPEHPQGTFEQLEVRTINPRRDKFDALAIVTDATFKKTSDSDLVAIGVLGRKTPDLYLLDLVWERLTFLETLRAILELRKKWPRVTQVCIEDKANGPAIINTLKQKVPGVIAIEPLGGKEARIAAAAPFIEAGNLWLPMHYAKRREFVAEAAAFPKAAHDDGIDMIAHAVLRFGWISGASKLAALVKWGSG